MNLSLEMANVNRETFASPPPTEGISLQDYQLAPIKRIVSRCEKQKGVLVYYDTGTGKTYIGLSFLQNFPEYTLYVIIPKVLVFSWESSEKNINSTVSIKYVTHEELAEREFIPDRSRPYVIVADEAHNLLRVIGSGTKYGMVNYDAIVGAKKLLFMTATPFVDGINDIAILINMCAGKKLLEPDEDVFHKYNKKPITSLSFLRGWAIPLVANKFTLSIIYLSAFFSYINELMHTLVGDYGQRHYGQLPWEDKDTLHGAFSRVGDDKSKDELIRTAYDSTKVLEEHSTTQKTRDEFISKWGLKKVELKGSELNINPSLSLEGATHDQNLSAIFSEKVNGVTHFYSYFYPGTSIRVVVPDREIDKYVDTDRNFVDAFTKFVMNIITFGKWNSLIEKSMIVSEGGTGEMNYETERLKVIKDKLENGMDEKRLWTDLLGRSTANPYPDVEGVVSTVIFTMLGYLLIYIICRQLIIKEEFLPEIEELDTRKIIDLCRPYILVYQKNSKTNDQFPDHKIEPLYINYDHHQLIMWLKITVGYMESDFYVKNGIKDVDRYGKKMNNDQYLDKGRSISNFPILYSDISFIYPTKFYMVLCKIFGLPDKSISSFYKILRSKNSAITSLYSGQLAKFINYAKKEEDVKESHIEKLEGMISGLLRGFVSRNFENSVVYSSFDESGSQLFVDFMNKYDIPHMYLHPGLHPEESKEILRIFRETRYRQILLLHPSMKEGVDIRGARQLHILEPILKLSDKIQVHGRVVRMKSHSHLGKSERNVVIYEWISSNRAWKNGVTAYLENFKTFAKHDTYVSFAFFHPKISQLESAESIVYKRSEKFSKYISDIQKTTSQYNREDMKKDLSNSVCDVWIPGETSDRPCSRILYSMK